MIDQGLLEILVCPETKEPLQFADEKTIESFNQQIEEGVLKNRAGQKVESKIDSGLISKDNPRFLYLIRDDIPVMLMDESIPL